jgi:hypothetical protein
MRHNTEGNVSTEWREEGGKGGEQTRMRPGMEQRGKKKQGVHDRPKEEKG